jgi:hypothetical protein
VRFSAHALSKIINQPARHIPTSLELMHKNKGRGKNCGVMTVFAAFVLLGSNADAESFGIHFLGNTTDGVTNVAGLVPISGWNNITNANSAFTSGIIRAMEW